MLFFCSSLHLSRQANNRSAVFVRANANLPQQNPFLGLTETETLAYRLFPGEAPGKISQTILSARCFGLLRRCIARLIKGVSGLQKAAAQTGAIQ